MEVAVRNWPKRLASGLERAIDQALTWASARFVGRADAAWLCKYSLEALAEGHPKSADRFARWAVAAAPDSALSYKTLGYVYLRNGRLLQARETLENALLLFASDESALRQLTDVYFALGDYVQAEAVVRRALKQPPPSTRTLMMLGPVLQKQGRLNDALATYKDAAIVKPDDPKVLGAIGEMYARMECYSEAVCTLGEALVLDPDLKGAQFYLAVSLANLGEMESARQHARRAMELDPHNEEFREVLHAIENGLPD